jgi:hypothetical protein
MISLRTLSKHMHVLVLLNGHDGAVPHCRYNHMTDEQYAALPFPPAAELSNMYAYYRRWPYYDDLR